MHSSQFRHGPQTATTRPSRERGSLLLLWALTISSTILVLTVGYFPLFQSTIASTNQTFALEQAMSFADAGIEHALWEIRTNNGAMLRESPQGSTNPWAVLASTACSNEIVGRTDGLLYGMTVTSCQRFPRTSTSIDVTAGDNYGGKLGNYTVWVVNYPSDRIRIVSRGLSTPAATPSAQNTMAVRTVRVDLQNDGTFRYAAFSDKYLYSEGRVQLDSYNSKLNGGCAYNITCGGVTNRFANGDVGTNGRTNQVAPSWGYIRMGGPSGLTDYHGVAFKTAWSQVVYTSPIGCLNCQMSSTVNQRAATMPHVQIPVAAPSYTNYGDKVYVGIPFTNPEMYCNEPRRYNTLQVAGGEFHIGPNCQIYIERPSGSIVAAGNALNTDGDGHFVLDAGRTLPFKLFIKDGGFNLDGPGFVNQTLQPELLQIYATGSNTVGNFAQTQPFYGLVYVEDPDGNASAAGSINIYPGNQGGVVSDMVVYGAIVAGDQLTLWDQSYQNSTYWVRLHHDESLHNIPMDGTDDGTSATRRMRYAVVDGSWIAGN